MLTMASFYFLPILCADRYYIIEYVKENIDLCDQEVDSSTLNCQRCLIHFFWFGVLRRMRSVECGFLN